MGCGPSKTQESAVPKSENAPAKEHQPSASLSGHEKPSSAAETEPATNTSQPGTVNVEFSEDGSSGVVKQPTLDNRYSRNHSLRSQVGLHVPHSSCRRTALRLLHKQLC